MDFMSENTAEVVERITTERETLRHQLEETKKKLMLTEDELKMAYSQIERLGLRLDEKTKELEELKAAQ